MTLTFEDVGDDVQIEVDCDPPLDIYSDIKKMTLAQAIARRTVDMVSEYINQIQEEQDIALGLDMGKVQ